MYVDVFLKGLVVHCMSCDWVGMLGLRLAIPGVLPLWLAPVKGGYRGMCSIGER